MIPIENKEKRLDWNAIRAEYINGASMRSLEGKYPVSKTAIAKHARDENWTALRNEAIAKANAKVIQKTAEKAADNATLAADIKRKGLLILNNLFDKFAELESTEHREYAGKNLTDIKRLRDLTAAFKDLTDGIPMCEGDKNAPIYELIRKLDNDG